MAGGARHRGWPIATLAALFVLLVRPAASSWADTQPGYQQCITECWNDGCIESFVAEPLCSAPCLHPTGSARVGLIEWECMADCKALCADVLQVHWRRQFQDPGFAEKFYGKWRFRRVLGFYEFASVVFSFGNLLVHVVGAAVCLRRFYLRRPRGVPAPPLRQCTWLLIPTTSVCCWAMSIWYHSRSSLDSLWPETVDTLTAASAPAGAAVHAVVRVPELSGAPAALAAVAGVAGYVLHVVTMLRGRVWDLPRHIVVCAVLYGSQAVLWWAWAATHGRTHPGVRLLVATHAAIGASFLLEAYDFQPLWGLFDAHSLWHLGTFVSTPLWYAFQYADLRHLEDARAAPPEETKKRE
ncbi:unnamed protein product [Pedinophyceae sp. YPF-701]|nr:unnamed protein product [Pedinophyceae sp. YPF-701]